jgi:hypothetical protein
MTCQVLSCKRARVWSAIARQLKECLQEISRYMSGGLSRQEVTLVRSRELKLVGNLRTALLQWLILTDVKLHCAGLRFKIS